MYIKSKAQTRLAESISLDDTEVKLERTNDFPEAPFNIIIDAGSVKQEIVQVTEIDTVANTMTVIRAQQGTYPVSHAKGALVYHCDITEDDLSPDLVDTIDDLVGDVAAMQTQLAPVDNIADPSEGTTVDAEARAAIASILDALETLGLMESAT
jgi:hypothetical protein